MGRYLWIKKPENLVIKHDFYLGSVEPRNFSNYNIAKWKLNDSPFYMRPLLHSKLEPVSRRCENDVLSKKNLTEVLMQAKSLSEF